VNPAWHTWAGRHRPLSSRAPPLGALAAVAEEVSVGCALCSVADTSCHLHVLTHPSDLRESGGVDAWNSRRKESCLWLTRVVCGSRARRQGARTHRVRRLALAPPGLTPAVRPPPPTASQTHHPCPHPPPPPPPTPPLRSTRSRPQCRLPPSHPHHRSPTTTTAPPQMQCSRRRGQSHHPKARACPRVPFNAGERCKNMPNPSKFSAEMLFCSSVRTKAVSAHWETSQRNDYLAKKFDGWHWATPWDAAAPPCRRSSPAASKLPPPPTT
jgi:hypothetical protein